MNINTQQVMFSSKSDMWATPQDFFDKLNLEFNFTLDPCADISNAKCAKFFDANDDGLVKSWANEVVFCNPPYSDIKNWCRKAYEESENYGATVVLLIPSRTDTKYWHDYVMKSSEIRFVKGRLKFGNQKNAAPFPSAVVVFRKSQKAPAMSVA